MEVAERIRAAGNELTTAERRVAEAILARPQAVGFGTVADLALAAGAGAATVVRLAGKLGFDGYTDLQSSVQRDLLHQLRPAADRIRDEIGDGMMDRHLATELGNVQATLDGVDNEALTELVVRLCDLALPVVVISGDASDGIARQFIDELALLRPGVSRLGGNEVAIRRDVSLLAPSTTVVVIDVRRYDRWVLDTVATTRERGMWIAALTDSYLSPLAASADRTFVLSAGSVGPFDSHVGTLALLNLVVTEVAGRLRSSASSRLDRVEDAWRAAGSLTES
ncbi:MAG TPA: MurR/RpiR family transcriptional regulator [Ilumatobacteraceae bacterium]|nr:MurR/RpiR family transcriptional regulator [Ilumatobacteraceae bacterium]